MLGCQLTSAAYAVDILQHLMLIQTFGGRKISLLSRTDPTHESKTSKEEPKAQQLDVCYSWQAFEKTQGAPLSL